MFHIYTLEQTDEWLNIINNYDNIDIYYYPEYVSSFQKNNDGDAQLIHYIKNNVEVINVVMKRDIAKHQNFTGKIESNTYFDYVTPYGYGGPLFKGDATNSDISEYYSEYKRFCKENSIVSEFIRFSPTLKNYDEAISNITTNELGPTVTLPIKDRKFIWENLNPKNKTSIRKSIKNNVKVYWGRSPELMKKFVNMYEETMKHDNADPYYFFNSEFYESLLEDLKYNMLIFYAKLDEKIISMSIILFSNKSIHYHLSASELEYRNISPTNLLLYEVAHFGNKNNFSQFHLGGGLGAKIDGLYKYKKSFSKSEDTKFVIGKIIFNNDVYEKLSNEVVNDDNLSFFPKYRICK